ncbi:nuclear transport factor 2 family protein [Candidatus Latescibacterota bacterium]
MFRTINVIFLVLVVSLIACKNAAPPMTDTERSAIEKQLIAQHNEITGAASRLDAEAVFSHFIDNERGILAFEGSLIMTREDGVNLVSEIYKDFQKITTEMNEEYVTVITPETAVYKGVGRSTYFPKSGDSSSITFAITIVFVLRDGEWKVLHMHESAPNETDQ